MKIHNNTIHRSAKTISSRLIYAAIFSLIVLTACDNTVQAPYVYKSNLEFTTGKAEFYGNYFANYQNNNNVISLSLYSDSLLINNKTSVGQHLNFDNIFIPAADSILPEGTYKNDTTGNSFTFIAGTKIIANGYYQTVGAILNYWEPLPKNSTSKLITDGTFTVSYNSNHLPTFTLNLTTDDKLKISGTFVGKINYTSAIIKKTKRK